MMEINEINALIRLLDDPDENIYEQVKNKLLLLGNDIITPLEDALLQTSNATIQNRLENIIYSIRFNYIYKELEKWAKNPQNLLKGYILITKFHYPNLDEEEINKSLNAIITDVWLEINDNLTALEKIKVINHIFFEIHGFQCIEWEKATHYNLYLNHLLHTKKGTNLTLSILYAIIAQQLKIPVYGVNLPYHFILAYQGESEIEKFLHKSEVLFYINISNKGKPFSKQEIELFLQQLRIKPKKSYFTPCSNSDVISLLIEHLIVYYKKTKELKKVKDFESIKKILE